MFDDLDNEDAKVKRKAANVNRRSPNVLDFGQGKHFADRPEGKGPVNGEDPDFGNFKNTSMISDDFDQRMQDLYHKGRRRGKRYSVIGLSASILIVAAVIAAGYYLLDQVKSISNQVGDNGGADLEATIDPDNICGMDYCCLASLKRMKRESLLGYDQASGCPRGFEIKSLDCENSLKWCEPLADFAGDCAAEGANLFFDDNISCCAGLTPAPAMNSAAGECTTATSTSVCIDCPNNICGPGENICNCPSDCRLASSSEEILLPTDEILATTTATTQATPEQ